MSKFDYDLFIVGGGSGGVRAARWAAKKGLKVALAEGERLGGTCVNVGCVPKKLFFHAAHVTQQLKDAQGFAWTIKQDYSHDWGQLKANIDRYITRLNGLYGKMLDNVGVTRYQAWARLVDDHTISLHYSELSEIESQHVSAQYILLAPGAVADRPELPGIDLGATSDDFFALTDKPKSAIVVGGGYIGVEMAGVLAGLGVKTSIVYRSNLPLRGFEQDLRIKLDRALRSQMAVYAGLSLEKVVKGEDKLKRVHLSDSTVVEAEFVLLATGRRPNSAALNLEAVGVECSSERRAIVVNDHYQSSIPHIYAVGDVIDRMQLTPVALAEAMRVVEHIVGGTMPPLKYDLVPTTVFSHPNIAAVGLSEAEALKRGHHILVYEADFKPLQQALQAEPKRVYMKMIVDQVSDRVLGCHMIGDEAGEQIQGLAVAMQAGVTKSQLDQTVGIHPTMAEEWVTMRTPRGT